MDQAARTTSALREHFGAGARVSHHPNHAGADRLNYRIDADGGSCWVKVARHEEDDRSLRQWAQHAYRLYEYHHGPRLLESFDLGGRVALRFELLNARLATSEDVRARLEDLLGIARGLHGDGILASTLGLPVSSGDCFRGIWVRRLRADLRELDGTVDPELHRWMSDEVDRLDAMTRDPAFDVSVRAPIHGDLWRDNIMLADGHLRLLDWEDLAIGDPVADDAVLLHEAFGADLEAWCTARSPVDDTEAMRLRTALVATLLDEVIDTLADAIETPDPRISETKLAQHTAALNLYRAHPLT